MTIDTLPAQAPCSRPLSRVIRYALGAIGLSLSSLSFAALVFNYTGGPLAYTPPPGAPTQSSPFGSFVFGTVTFDGLVDASFTGTVSSGFTGSVASSSLAPRPIGANSVQPPSFTFANGQLVAWNLRTDFILLPGFANYLVPLFMVNGSDTFSPVTGGQVLGRAGASGGQWTLQASPSPVPVPPAGLLFLAGMAWLGARLRSSKTGVVPKPGGPCPAGR